MSEQASAQGLPVTQPAHYSCFLCHSDDDLGFVERLYADLRATGVAAWEFHHDAKWGEILWKEIQCAIERHDKLLLVCSKSSLCSGPVLRELERALQEEDKAWDSRDQQRTNILFPISIDRYLFDDWQHWRKADVVAKVVGDFQDPAGYPVSLDRLVDALERGGKAAAAPSATPGSPVPSGTCQSPAKTQDGGPANSSSKPTDSASSPQSTGPTTSASPTQDPLPFILQSLGNIRRPVGLAALVAVVLYLVYKLILTLPVFAQVSPSDTARIIYSLVDKLFYLALVALVLALVVYLVERIMVIGGRTRH